MLNYSVLNQVKTSVRSAVQSRNIGILAPCFQKAVDPIQQLFLDKIREYRQKSNDEKNLVEPSPALQTELKSELEKVARQYGGKEGEDMTKFPTFKFEDPTIDPIKMETK
ncbi:ATP synthase-coupling factor 6, mitochondrial [Harmonia axyridis]|uniref:ATP synthase-coupling factor 6, mitochondrial n=1 Tax=Harmonia axyridis TaxID=115357 RepID=UPI001E2787E4|nr:ATP synthase-coupling factor 6, mitochondrial [Harmonia axyridis]